LTGDDGYGVVARETADYVLRDLTHPQGGFFSAEDADSHLAEDPEGESTEGAFYVWTLKEILRHLGKTDGEVFAYHFGVRPSGNVRFDPHGELAGKNVLYRSRTERETAAHFQKEPADIRRTLASGKEKLLAARSLRPRPHRDEKVLTGWNGLMIGALARLYQQTQEERYRRAATAAASFIRMHLFEEADRRLYRRWRDGDRKVEAMCDDYAFLTSGLLDLYETDFDVQWLEWAFQLTEILLENYHDAQGCGFFMSASDVSGGLPVRVREETDGAVPSATSIAVLSLLRLSRLSERGDFYETALRSAEATASRLQPHPAAAPLMMSALRQILNPTAHVILAGSPDAGNAEELLRCVWSFAGRRPSLMRIADAASRESLAEHLPFVENIEWQDNPARAVVCRQGACREPTTESLRLEVLLHDAESHPHEPG
jgi:uncharacterized protein YyaL (SSP411 family)